MREPVPSTADGAFQFHDLAAGSYHIHATFGTNALPEWVADAAVVSVEAGQTTRGVQITASRGGFLEAAVLAAEDRKPLARVTVNAYRENYQFAGTSDTNGIALLRLPPGNYQVMASVSGSQNTASVEAGKTNRVELEIAAPKKITGIVRQPDGQPAAGVLAQIMGGFGRFGLGGASVKTDATGKFELKWNQNQFMQMRGVPCVLIRDEKHNLAVAQDLDEDIGPLDLKLVPGVTLAGRVECNGKPLTNAAATLMFWTGNRGMNLPGLSSATNAPGRFEITALPPGRKYSVRVSAPGYGQWTINNIDTSTEGRRMELDPVELKLANLKLAGQVLDADDKPVPSANVALYGDGQPNANAVTDRQGRFHFEHVCEGSGSNPGQQSKLFWQRFRGRRRDQRRPATRPTDGQCHAWFQISQSAGHGHGPGRQTRRGRGVDRVSIFLWQSAMDKGRRQRRLPSHLVAPAVAGAAVRRHRAAGDSRFGPQLGGHRRVAGGRHQPRREIETGPNRRRSGQQS